MQNQTVLLLTYPEIKNYYIYTINCYKEMLKAKILTDKASIFKSYFDMISMDTTPYFCIHLNNHRSNNGEVRVAYLQDLDLFVFETLNIDTSLPYDKCLSLASCSIATDIETYALLKINPVISPFDFNLNYENIEPEIREYIAGLMLENYKKNYGFIRVIMETLKTLSEDQNTLTEFAKKIKISKKSKKIPLAQQKVERIINYILENYKDFYVKS